MKTAGMLVAVAVLLAAVGAVFIWSSQPDEADLGDYRADKMGELCDAVDPKPFQELASEQDGANSSGDPNAEPPTFNCEIRLVSDDKATDYVTVTLTVKARISETVSDAEDLWDNLLDVEKSEDHKVDKSKKPGDDAVTVTLPESQRTQECRLHTRDSNAVLSSTVLLNGGKLKCDKSISELMVNTTQSTLDVMGSE